MYKALEWEGARKVSVDLWQKKSENLFLIFRKLILFCVDVLNLLYIFTLKSSKDCNR